MRQARTRPTRHASAGRAHFLAMMARRADRPGAGTGERTRGLHRCAMISTRKSDSKATPGQLPSLLGAYGWPRPLPGLAARKTVSRRSARHHAPRAQEFAAFARQRRHRFGSLLARFFSRQDVFRLRRCTPASRTVTAGFASF